METKKCTKCFTDIHIKATICPVCKSKQLVTLSKDEVVELKNKFRNIPSETLSLFKKQSKFLPFIVAFAIGIPYGLTQAIINLLVVGIIYGLYKLWNKKMLGKKRRIAITTVAILFLIGLVTPSKSSTSTTSNLAKGYQAGKQATQPSPSNRPTVDINQPTDIPEPTLIPDQKDINGFPTDAEKVTVTNLDKAPRTYVGKKIQFTCKVVSFAKDDNGNASAINCADPNNVAAIVQINIAGFDSTKINQQDEIRIYGLGDGSATGKNAFGAEVTQSLVLGLYINDLTSGYKE